MQRTLKFEKDPDSKWYVVLPEWEKDRSALQMVAGADTWLDILAKGEYHVVLSVSDEELPNATGHLDILKYGSPYAEDSEIGAWYSVGPYMGVEYNLDVWLCSVTKFVFGNFPEKIYYWHV
jgi:hypothetical protein